MINNISMFSDLTYLNNNNKNVDIQFVANDASLDLPSLGTLTRPEAGCILVVRHVYLGIVVSVVKIKIRLVV